MTTKREFQMGEYAITESTNAHGAKIVVIGVGAGGGNMLDILLQSDIADKVKLVAANTDAQALEGSNAPHKIQIGPKLTKGLGAGMKPEVGKAAAYESYDEIKDSMMV